MGIVQVDASFYVCLPGLAALALSVYHLYRQMQHEARLAHGDSQAFAAYVVSRRALVRTTNCVTLRWRPHWVMPAFGFLFACGALLGLLPGANRWITAVVLPIAIAGMIAAWASRLILAIDHRAGQFRVTAEQRAWGLWHTRRSMIADALDFSVEQRRSGDTQTTDVLVVRGGVSQIDVPPARALVVWTPVFRAAVLRALADLLEQASAELATDMAGSTNAVSAAPKYRPDIAGSGTPISANPAQYIAALHHAANTRVLRRERADHVTPGQVAAAADELGLAHYLPPAREAGDARAMVIANPAELCDRRFNSDEAAFEVDQWRQATFLRVVFDRAGAVAEVRQRSRVCGWGYAVVVLMGGWGATRILQRGVDMESVVFGLLLVLMTVGLPALAWWRQWHLRRTAPNVLWHAWKRAVELPRNRTISDSPRADPGDAGGSKEVYAWGERRARGGIRLFRGFARGATVGELDSTARAAGCDIYRCLNGEADETVVTLAREIAVARLGEWAPVPYARLIACDTGGGLEVELRVRAALTGILGAATYALLFVAGAVVVETGVLRPAFAVVPLVVGLVKSVSSLRTGGRLLSEVRALRRVWAQTCEHAGGAECEMDPN